MTGLEQRDAAAAAVAVKPRVTLDQIKGLIASERYFLDDTLTICVLTLANGYKVTGESAAADPVNFNEELGRKIAKEKAVAEIWPLAGFLLRDTLHKGDHPSVMRCKVTLNYRAPAHSYDPADQDKLVADGENLHFYAICPKTCDPSGSDENLIFGQYTPNFQLSAHVRNKGVLAALEQGAAYYVDFTPAP